MSSIRFTKVVVGSDSETFLARHNPERKEELTFHWKIANFKRLYAAGQSSEEKQIARIPFAAGISICTPSNWELDLQLNTHGLAAQLKYLGSNPCNASYKLLLKPENGEYRVVNANANSYFTNSVTCKNYFSHYGTLDALQDGGFLSNDELQLKLEFTVSIKDTLISATEVQLKRDLSWSFKNALDTGLRADVTFIFVDGIGSENVIGKICAHRLILSLRSSVFATMFASGMKEATEGKVKIEDMTPKAFEHLLKFIYSGEVDGEWGSVAVELISAADKYDLKVLQNYLFENIDSGLTVKNVWRIRDLAKLYNFPQALKSTMKFIKENTEDFVESINDISFKQD